MFCTMLTMLASALVPTACEYSESVTSSLKNVRRSKPLASSFSRLSSVVHDFSGRKLASFTQRWPLGQALATILVAISEHLVVAP